MKGLDTFREFFKEFNNCYIAIGGAACDDYFEGQGLEFRTTKDIDIILVVEEVNDLFIAHFWEFITAGGYRKSEHAEEIQYYRFTGPNGDEFPEQIELFSRTPDLLTEIEEGRFTPIPANEDLSSLSAILMDDDYYAFTKEQTVVQNELHRANEAALICLKAKAYLDLSQRKAEGERIDSRKINKHRSDIFRLAVTLTADLAYTLPDSVKDELNIFVEEMNANTPDITGVLKSLGVSSNIKAQTLLQQIAISFNLSNTNVQE